MSSKTLASAMLSYGADLRVTNLVLEIIFSILPVLYSSKFKIFDSKDELVVDLVFHYVRQILIDRRYYEDMMVPLLEEQFRDLNLEELDSAEIGMLCNVAVKRLVGQAMQAAERPFKGATSSVTGLPQEDFLKRTLQRYMILKTSHALNFAGSAAFDTALLKKLNLHDTTAPYSRQTLNLYFKEQTQAGDGKFEQKETGFELLDPHQLSAHPKSITLASAKFVGGDLLDAVKNKQFIVIEPFVSISIKDKATLIECLEALQPEYSLATINLYLNQFAALVNALARPKGEVAVDLFVDGPIKDNKNLDHIAEKTIFCSPRDLQQSWKYYIIQKGHGFLTSPGTPAKFAGAKHISVLRDAILGICTLSMRANVESAFQGGDDKKGIENSNAAWSSKSEELRNFKKTLVYFDLLGGYRTIQIAHVFKEYKPSDFFPTSGVSTTTAILENFKVATTDAAWTMENMLKLSSASPESLTVSQALFVELLSSPEFDAITKSLLVPITMFNALQLIPNVEIGSMMREIMRSQGMFRGMDECLDSYLANLLGYLEGFSFEGCGDWSGIL